MNPEAEIGIIGGSGFYEFLDNKREIACVVKRWRARVCEIVSIRTHFVVI